ncbi:PepSY-associated TM helix domain-containing protein [Shumkonia mesophila]|uniref:PepSY-associated TM helix domain-containing protein n=1 Tax=Shumkonia mesophila TaxID=2838854 RepID=UPI002934EC91|nr:PepSY-associated TM helix domain-containing protein [Shumkonia mesophila]
MKAWFLKLHRWLALIFTAPLAVVIVTGLVLSFEPWLVTGAIVPDSLSAERVQTLLAQHDPNGQARALVYRSYDGTLTMGAGRSGGVTVDAASGEAKPGPSTLAAVMGTMRGLHERLLIDAGWLVIASTAAMLVLVLLGGLMGWPRFANTLGGWHKAMAWGLLPLTVLSPLTALLMAAGVTFATPPAAPAAQGAPLKLAQAVDIVGRDHDLSSLVWLRPQGGRVMARLVEDGEYRLYAVTPQGIQPMERNWPRLWHEGNFAGAWSAAMNVILSVVMTGLLATGAWIWLRRQFRRRARRPLPTAPA